MDPSQLPDCRQSESWRFGIVLEPKIVQEVTSFPEAMSLVDGVGFAFTREFYERFRCVDVLFKKIEGQPLALESAVVFRKGVRSSVLPSIIAALQVKKNPAPVLPFRAKAAGISAITKSQTQIEVHSWVAPLDD
jgi:hypothetical protein